MSGYIGEWTRNQNLLYRWGMFNYRDCVGAHRGMAKKIEATSELFLSISFTKIEDQIADKLLCAGWIIENDGWRPQVLRKRKPRKTGNMMK